MAEAKIKRNWFQNFKSELKRVIWPTKKQTAKNTLAVIFLVAIISIIVIVLDFVFIKANDFVIDKVTGGKITAVKEEKKKVTEALAEIKKYVSDEEYATYEMFANYGFYDSTALESMLEELKNDPVDENTDVVEEQISEETPNQEIVNEEPVVE